MSNPFLKKAKLAALGKFKTNPLEMDSSKIDKVPALPHPPGIGGESLTDRLEESEKRSTKVPMTTARGLKESQTKKIRNILKAK